MSAKKQKEKLYTAHKDGSISFKNGRHAWGVDVPAYAYDIWMSLIGLRPIGVYALLWRLARDGVTYDIGMKRLAKHAHMGYRTFLDDVQLLHELKWIVFTPSQQDLATGEWGTPEFEVLDIPRSIPVETIQKYSDSPYTPLSKWLVEAEVVLNDTTMGVGSNDTTLVSDNNRVVSDNESLVSNDNGLVSDSESILEPSVEPSVGPVIEPLTASDERPKVFTLYEHFGPLTEAITNKLKGQMDEYGRHKVERAWEIAVAEDTKLREANGCIEFPFAYVQKILTRWESEGYDGDDLPKQRTAKQEEVPGYLKDYGYMRDSFLKQRQQAAAAAAEAAAREPAPIDPDFDEIENLKASTAELAAEAAEIRRKRGFA